MTPKRDRNRRSASRTTSKEIDEDEKRGGKIGVLTTRGVEELPKIKLDLRNLEIGHGMY